MEDISPFLIPMFWACAVCPGFQGQGGSLACFLTCVILRFTSSATPADCIEVSIAAEPFQSTYLQMCPQALVEILGLSPRPSIRWAKRCTFWSLRPVELSITSAFNLFQSQIWEWRKFTCGYSLAYHLSTSICARIEYHDCNCINDTRLHLNLKLWFISHT